MASKSSANIEFDPVLVATRKMERLCGDLESARSLVMSYNMELTELLFLPQEEKLYELSVFEKRKLRPYLDQLMEMKDEFFYEPFSNIIAYIEEKSPNIHKFTHSTHADLHGQEAHGGHEVYEYDDLFREFIGIFVCSMCIAAKCASERSDFRESCVLYEKIIHIMKQSGCYLNTQGVADGSAIEINRIKAHLGSCLFKGGYLTLSMSICEDALRHLGPFLHHTDPDIEAIIHILSFFNKTNVLYNAEKNSQKYKMMT